MIWSRTFFQNHYTERPKVESEEKIGDKIPKLELKRSNESKTFITEREIQCGKMKLVHKVVNVRKPASKNSSKWIETNTNPSNYCISFSCLSMRCFPANIFKKCTFVSLLMIYKYLFCHLKWYCYGFCAYRNWSV